jgi:hypothetical protein
MTEHKVPVNIGGDPEVAARGDLTGMLGEATVKVTESGVWITIHPPGFLDDLMVVQTFGFDRQLADVLKRVDLLGLWAEKGGSDGTS